MAADAGKHLARTAGEPASHQLDGLALLIERLDRNWDHRRDNEAGAAVILYWNRAEYEAEWAKWVKEDGFRVRSCKSTDSRIQILGDVAIFTHSVQTELSTKQGDSTVHERETIVFERRDSNWIAVHEHLSPDPEKNAPAEI